MSSASVQSRDTGKNGERNPHRQSDRQADRGLYSEKPISQKGQGDNGRCLTFRPLSVCVCISMSYRLLKHCSSSLSVALRGIRKNREKLMNVLKSSEEVCS